MQNIAIYLAGPDVFRPDAKAHGERLKALCQKHRCKGLYPLDNELPAGLTGPEAAHWIFQENIKLIEQADGMLANVNNFRGHEPDSGTAFEIGYAYALGKPVFLYLSDDRPMNLKIQTGHHETNGLTDENGLLIENFDLPVNLMLACSSNHVSRSFLDALEMASFSLKWREKADQHRNHRP